MLAVASRIFVNEVQQVVFKNQFEKFLTYFAKVSLIGTIVTGIIAALGSIFLQYIEFNINQTGPKLQSLWDHYETNINMLKDCLHVSKQVSFYVGFQGFILSQIINLGYFLVYGTSAIHYSYIFPVLCH